MLIKEYFELEVANKPYKYQTKLNMVSCLKKLELWDLEYETLTPAFCWERIDGIINQNVKRVYAGYVRNIFNNGRNQSPVVMGESKKPFWTSMMTKNGLLLMLKNNESLPLPAGNFLGRTLVSQILDLSAMPSNIGGDSSTRRHRL